MIREVREDEYAILQQISLDCFDENIARYKNMTLARMMVKRYYRDKAVTKRLQGNAKIFVMDDHGIQGFIEMQDSYVANIFVKPQNQRKGYGRQLIDAGINYCMETAPETTEITLDATKDAIHFYEKCGFIFLNQSKSQLGVDFYPMKKYTKNIETIEIS